LGDASFGGKDLSGLKVESSTSQEEGDREALAMEKGTPNGHWNLWFLSGAFMKGDPSGGSGKANGGKGESAASGSRKTEDEEKNRSR